MEYASRMIAKVTASSRSLHRALQQMNILAVDMEFVLGHRVLVAAGMVIKAKIVVVVIRCGSKLDPIAIQFY